MKKSFLRSEIERPLCDLRRRLQAIVDQTELGRGKTPAKKIEEERTVLLEYIEQEGTKLWDELDLKFPGAFPFEKSEWRKALSWLKGSEQVQMRALTEPSVQAVWGCMLLLNKTLGYPKDEKEIIFKNKRLIDEKNLMASLLLGTINSKATIAWGKTGSWFYNDPVNNHINMDPGQALLLGLQNSRAILLHEVGHSQITGDRSPKMKAIKERIDELCPKVGKHLRKLPKTKEERVEVAKLSREYSMRESFWQYAEDACVNTYGEIEGSNFTNDIIKANMRIYTVILLGREHKALLEKQLSKSPLAGLEKVLKGLESAPTTKEAEEKALYQDIEQRLKAAAAAYPLSRGWIDLEDQSDWEMLGAKKTPEIEDLYQRLSKPRESYSIGEGMPIGAIQPSIIGKRFELVSATTVEKITKECIETRNQLIDETFDQFILPLLEKLPDPPEPQRGGSGRGPAPNPNPNDDTNPGKDPEEWEEGEVGGQEGEVGEKGKTPKDGKEPEGEGGKENPIGTDGDKKKKPENTVEEETKTLEESRKEGEKEREKEEEEKKKRSEEALKQATEAIRNSMGVRSPLEELPTGCGNYSEAMEALRPQIKVVTNILKKIALKQKTLRLGEREILPDPMHGVAGFEIDSFIERKRKESTKEPITMEDRKHFRHQDNQAKRPATTHLAFYIDGSGSMSGPQAERTMLTLIIFNEAAKKVPEIQVSAVYSGAGKTIRLLSGGKLSKEQEKLVANILQEGFACGDNEISPEGLAEMNEEISKATPRSGAFGMTHTVFLTDGWTDPTEEESIAKAIKTTLDGNPLSTFDTFILNGGKGGSFREASKKVKTKREAQMPSLTECEEVKDICPAIVNALMTRIKKFKSFEPKPVSLTKDLLKRNIRKLKEQEAQVLDGR
jgi:hypothetical protein